MEGWLAIVLLVLVGLILIYLELIFVPGTTVLGLVGLIVTGIGIYIAYERYGAATGSAVLFGSLALTIGALVYSFKAKTWDRFSLKTTNTSSVKPKYTQGLQIEMRGLAVSDLKPIGKAEFDNKTYEVTSHGHLIDSGTEIKIVRLTNNKIIVESINT